MAFRILNSQPSSHLFSFRKIADKLQVGAEVQAQLPGEKLAMRLLPLQIFQALKGAKHDLEGSFVKREDSGVGIAVKKYNVKQPLIVTLVAVFQPITSVKEAALAKSGAPPPRFLQRLILVPPKPMCLPQMTAKPFRVRPSNTR